MQSGENVDILNLKMNRKGFGQRREIREQVKGVYHSSVIEEIKANGFEKSYGRLTFHLAQEFGFCYGVDRAVELAYETCRYNPEKRVFLTTEIIHNPTVNQNLMDMNVRFLSGPYKNAEHADVTPEDIVIVPAFGTSVQELHELYKTGCHLVDTICGSVVVVWKRVERYAREGYTSIIHGKYYHEETIATSSRVSTFDDAHYLIVFNEDDAQYVCDYIRLGGDKKEFLKRFANSVSEGFDPDLHLDKIGLANQTTMLSSESLKIQDMFRDELKLKFGEENLADHLMAFDTICSATQERQDAIVTLRDKKPDIMLVVGGYNSSNTAHLQEIAMKFSKSFHINKPECVVDAKIIKHKPFGEKEEVQSLDWLPLEGNVSIGITAGASTPNKVMGDVIERILKFQ